MAFCFLGVFLGNECVPYSLCDLGRQMMDLSIPDVQAL